MSKDELRAALKRLWWRLLFRLEPLQAVLGRFFRRKITCSDCDHFFDPADSRAFLGSKRFPELQPACPACNQISRGRKAWAVHNDCNGIFTCMVRDTKAEALAEAAPCNAETAPDVFKVVPVRVLVEPEDDWWKREYDERERERYR